MTSDPELHENSAEARPRPLFTKQGAATLPERPALIGGKCVCGHVFFPMQSLGCELCGRTGAALTQIALAGRGTVRAHVQVHRHRAATPKTPFTVVAVELDDGPIVRGLYHPQVDETLSIGKTVVTMLVSLKGRDGEKRAGLRFAAPETI